MAAGADSYDHLGIFVPVQIGFQSFNKEHCVQFYSFDDKDNTRNELERIISPLRIRKEHQTPSISRGRGVEIV